MSSKTSSRTSRGEQPTTSLIEVEAQPRTPFAPRDWGDLLIARQLALPLFRELPGRGITSDVFDRVHRVDAHTWRLRIAPAARWSDSARITSGDVCQQIAHAARGTGAGALTGRLINRLRVHSSAELSISTWLPVGEIGRVLVSPAFGLASGRGRSSGCFTVTTTGTDVIRLRHASSRRSIDAASGLSMATLREAVAEGTLAATSLLTGGLLGTDVPGYAVTEADLDILICLQLPRGLQSAQGHVLSQAIDRFRIERLTRGLVKPASSAVGPWISVPAGHLAGPTLLANPAGRPTEHCWNMEFTDFHPNGIVAADVTKQLREHLGLKVTARQVEYDKFIEPGQATVIRLILVAATWAHPAGLIAPCLLSGQTHRNPPLDDFTRFSRASIAAEDITAATRFAEQAQEAQQAGGGPMPFIPIGQLRSQILHRERQRPWIPPSGWFDFADFLSATPPGET